MSLITKIEEKLASQPVEDILRQKVDADLGEFALNCVKNASIAETLQGILSTQGGQSAAGGLAGAAIGGLGTALTASKNDDESEEEFKKRRINDSVMGGVAGGAVGAAAPIAATYFNSLNDHLSEKDPSMGQKALSFASNPQTLSAVAGAGGAIAGDNYLADKKIKSLKELLEALPKSSKGLPVNPVTAQVEERFKSLAQSKISPSILKRLGLIGAGGAAGLLAFKGIANQPAFSEPVFQQ